MAVQAGKLESVTIHHASGSTKNARGDSMPTFVDRAAYAEVRAIRAEDRYTDDEFVDRAPHVFIMRHFPRQPVKRGDQVTLADGLRLVVVSDPVFVDRRTREKVTFVAAKVRA